MGYKTWVSQKNELIIYYGIVFICAAVHKEYSKEFGLEPKVTVQRVGPSDW